MKRLLIALLTVFPLLANAAAGDLFINQRDSNNANTLTRQITHPAGTSDGVFGYIGSSQLPGFLQVGPGLTLSGGILDAVPGGPVSWVSITGKPTFAAVAASGAYADLSGLPTIPAAQQQVDWNATSGVTSIASKPALAPVATLGTYASLASIPVTFAPSPHTQAFSTITATPTTCSGYGIADCVTSSSLTSTLGGYATTSALTTGLAGKFNSPAGTTAQYVRGDGSLATLPASSGGTVTSIAAGTGLSGGTITTSGTISLPNTGTAGTYQSVTTDAQGRITAGLSLSINDAPGRTLVTTTTATGYQVSASRVAEVCYEGSFATTSTIGGASSASVFLETADTNSTTASDWTVRAQQTYSNNITLAVVLSQVQTNNWSFCRYIPAGKFVRIRSGSITGTASVTLSTQQETLH